MTSTALISEKERLYHFYVTCNMSKEETCKAMGYYMKSDKNRISIHKVEERLSFYKIFKPKYIVIFNKAKGMYLKYGVTNCMDLSETRDKIIQTNLKKYGTKFYTQTDEYKEKSKQTCLKKYGVDNIAKLQETQMKMKATCLAHYGTENVYASDYAKEKIKNTCLKRYGVENYTQSNEFKEKVKKICLRKYGTEWPSSSEISKNKAKQTNLEKYGTENVYASDYAKEKMKQTCIERYGVEHYTQTSEYKQRVIKTNLEKYGTEYYTQTKEYKEKLKTICQKKYGVDNPSQYQPVIDKIYKTKKVNGSLNTSKPEKIINDLLKEKYKEVKRQYKSELYPFMCDFYIPEIDLYIEYQGVVDHGHYKHKVIGPYNENSEEHLKILKIWQEKSINHPRYKSMIKTWTIRDPLKRKTAHENGLNWLEFFTMDEFMKWYNSI